jgi:hypothetical protein
LANKHGHQEQFFDLLNNSQSETRIALGSHICWPNEIKRRNFIEDLTQMLPAKFGSIWPSSFRGEDQQIWLPRAILVSDWLLLSKSSPLKLLGQIKPSLVGSIYVRSSIKLLHLLHLAKQFQRRRLF